jgi:hypothetical protein
MTATLIPELPISVATVADLAWFQIWFGETAVQIESVTFAGTNKTLLIVSAKLGDTCVP